MELLKPFTTTIKNLTKVDPTTVAPANEMAMKVKDLENKLNLNFMDTMPTFKRNSNKKKVQKAIRDQIKRITPYFAKLYFQGWIPEEDLLKIRMEFKLVEDNDPKAVHPTLVRWVKVQVISSILLATHTNKHEHDNKMFKHRMRMYMLEGIWSIEKENNLQVDKWWDYIIMEDKHAKKKVKQKPVYLLKFKEFDPKNENDAENIRI